MLHLINEELFSLTPTSGRNPVTEKLVNRLVVRTSNRIVRYSNVTSKRVVDTEHDCIPEEEKRFEVFSTELIRVVAPSMDLLNDVEHRPMTMKITDILSPEAKWPQSNIELRCITDPGRPNRANIFVVAFPFNGRIETIEEDPKYRIYKGTIMSSVKAFVFNGKRYRKILYLVMEPNLNLFDPEHKYHTDKISMSIHSYCNPMMDEPNAPTQHECMTVSIIDKDQNYTIDWKEWESEEYIIPTRGTPLWTTFHFTPKDENGNQLPYIPPAAPQTPSAKPHTQVKPHREGSLMVSVNKHGIRRETSIHGKEHGYYRETRYESDSYESQKPRGNKGKKSKKRRK